jgi:hypothetical protein
LRQSRGLRHRTREKTLYYPCYQMYCESPVCLNSCTNPEFSHSCPKEMRNAILDDSVTACERFSDLEIHRVMA